MAFTEPTDVFFNTGPLSFSVPVTLHFTGGDVVKQMIFDDPFLDTQAGEVVLETRRPMLTARESDLTGVIRGLLVTATTKIGPRNFSVIEVRPDGSGMAYVELAYEG